MKHITKILTLVMALTLSVSLLTACTGGEEKPTTKPGTSTTTKPNNDMNEGSSKPGSDKNEGNNKPTTKPEESKPEESKPEESKPEESKPDTDTTGKK